MKNRKNFLTNATQLKKYISEWWNQTKKRESLVASLFPFPRGQTLVLNL